MSFNAVCYFEFIRFLQVGLKKKKSSSNLKLHQAAMNMSLSQWNRLNYGTSKFATCFFNSRMYTFQYNKCFPIVFANVCLI